MSNDSVSDSPFVLVSSPGMHDMATNIGAWLGEHGVRFPHYEVEFTTFSSGEVLPVIPHTVRRQHVFFLHPLQHPDPNTAFMMMLLTNDALRRADVSGITVVAPFFPYLRQDRKDQPRVPISARLMADLVESNPSVQRLITADMHTDQEQGFFSIPVDNLNSRMTFAAHVREYFGDLGDLMVIAPDFGGALRARRFASRLGDVPVGIFEKRRPGPNQSEIVSVVSEQPVEGMRVIIYDDMIDTGGTIASVASALQGMGAREVHIFATHGIFSGGAVKRFSTAGVSIATADTIPRAPDFLAENSWLTHVSMSDLFAEAIYEASMVGGSVSKLSA